MPLAPVPRHPRRLVYLGTPAMAMCPLEALVAAGFDVALVVTRPDARRGRGSERSPSPVAAAAAGLGIPLAYTVDDAIDASADLGVVVAFGRIIKPHVLAALPMVNLHFSLLPRWRGAAPVERAILAGDTETGVCVMDVEEGLDTGGVYASARVPIAARATADELRTVLVQVGTGLLVSTLQSGLEEPAPQVGDVTYAAKLTPDDLHLQWERPAVELDRVVRVGGAWTTFRGRRLKVHAAEPVPDQSEALHAGQLAGDVVATGAGGLRLITVQPEGKPPLPFADWRNGARPAAGERLGG